MIWFKRIGLLFLLLLLLIFGVLGYVTMTNGGMKRMFSLGESYLTDDLTVGSVEGKLVGPGSFSDIEFKNGSGLFVEVSSVSYDWQPKQLFSRRLNVDRLNVTGVTVRLPEVNPESSSEPAEPFKLSDLRIPLAVEFEELSVTDIAVFLPGSDEPFIINELLLRAAGEDDSLKLVELSATAPQGNLQLGGTLNTTGDWPLALESEWNFDHQQFGAFNGSGSMVGDLQSLNVVHTVEGFVNATVTAEVKDVTGDFSWDGNIAASSDDLGIISEGLNGIPFELNTDTNGSLAEYFASGTLATDHEQTGPLETAFDIRGDLQQLVVNDSTVEFQNSAAELRYKGTVDLTSLEADMAVDWTDLAYPIVNEPAMVLSPNGSLRFTGTAEQYTVKMNSKVEHDQTGLLNVLVGVTGSPDKIVVNMFSAEGPPTSVYAVGEIDLASREIDLKGNWKDVRWPLVGEDELLRSAAADFSVSGSLDDYQVNATMALAGKDIPEGDWALSTKGNTESLSDLSLQGNVLEGQINARGAVVLVPTPEWDLAIDARNINPGVQWKEHAGKISFSTTTKGSMTDSGPDLIANIENLSGNYRGQPLAGGGQVSFADGEMSADGMSVKVGSATIDIEGALGDELDLALQLDASDLAHLVPGMKGDIEVDGKITGTREAPVLEFDLAAKDFNSGSVQSDSFIGSGLIDLTGKKASRIKMTGESLKVSGYQWQDVKIDGAGRPEEHQLSISLAGDAPDIALEMKGGVKGERWNGSIDNMQILQTPIGDWKLHEPVTMEATKESFTSQILCLTNLPAVLCADGSWLASTGTTGRLAVESFNSDLFSDLMPPDIAIDAPLSGTVDFTMKNGANPNATARFDIPAGRIQFTSSGDVITAILGESQINVDLQDDQVKTTADLALGEIGTIKANTLITDLYGKQNLSGIIKSEVQDISLAGIGATQLQSIDGAFFSDVMLGGTLIAPQITGDVNLADFAAEVPSLSLKFTDGNIKAVSDGQGRLNIEGKVFSGEGDLGISGFFNPETGQMEIALKGEDFQVANAERQKAVISPDIEVKIDNETISVLGDLGIPSAFIQAGGDSGVIVESADVVVKESTDATLEKEANGSVKLGVKVSLGDDVRVKVGQFDGALGGGITIEQLPGKVPTGSGVIEVVSGDFLVYGQKLTMERGRILFGGGPLDNPALDIDVARDVPAYELKAGAEIRGTAQVPILELKSDPEQTDANTLSYILFGKPVGTGASYTLGKFITPSLYVSYGYDLFDKIHAYNLRYRITERLALIASSSKEAQSSADFIYTLER